MRLPRVLAAVVFVCAAVPFVAAIGMDYNRFDDFGMLKETAGYQGLGFEQLRWMFTTTHMGHYQPLAWLTFGMEWTVFGADPAVSHTVNVLVHAVNAVLVFVLGMKLIGAARPELGERARAWGAAVAALVFAVHPLRVESVAWVTERRDVLSLCFYLAAMLCYVNMNEPGADRKRGWTLVWVFFVLSLLAKAWGMTFFLVLLVVDVYPLKRVPRPGLAWVSGTSRLVLLEKVPFALVGMGWAVIAGLAASSMPGTTRNLATWGVMDRACQAVYGLMFYLWKTVWPVGLSAVYELPKEMSVHEPRVVAAMVTVVVLGVLAVALRRRVPGVAAALAVFVVVVSPVLGLLQSGIQLVADRYAYVSMVGVAVVVGGAVALCGVRLKGCGRWVLAGLVTAVLAALGVMSWRQTLYWRDAETLFGHSIAVGQEGPILRLSYGREVEGAGRAEEAIGQYRRALELEPQYGEAWFAIGSAAKGLKRYAEAKEALTKAIELMPDSWRADEAMGLLLAEKFDDLEGALPYFRSAVVKIEGPQAWVFQPGPYITLAQALYDLGDVAGARRELEKALRFRETQDKAAAALKQIGARR